MKHYLLLILFFLSTGFLFAQPNGNNSSAIDTSTATNGDVGKYGFKNLFVNKEYNSALPYDGQIHPQAWGFIQDYLDAHGKSLNKMKSWGVPYFTLIENVLMQYGLPHELKYLAVIESGLNTNATSWVGARGPWQFMPYTAKEYGLNVNAWVDERTDYFRSTHAAAKYLTTLYNDLHDWLLVIAAYNGGPARVYSAIKKSGSRDFWKLQYYLPAESRTHVKKFIATHYIMEGNGGITTVTKDEADNAMLAFAPGKNVLNQEELTNSKMQSISGKYNSVIIAKNILIDIANFNRYNPDFDKQISVKGSFDLRLPGDKMEVFNAKKFQILDESMKLLLAPISRDGK